MQIFVPRNPVAFHLNRYTTDRIGTAISVDYAHVLDLEPYLVIVAEDVVAAYEQLRRSTLTDKAPDLVVPIAGSGPGLVEAITNASFNHDPAVYVSIYHKGEILVWEAYQQPGTLNHRGAVMYDGSQGTLTLGPAKTHLNSPKPRVSVPQSDHTPAPVSDNIREVAEYLLAGRERALDQQLADILEDLERIPGKIAASRIHPSSSVRARRQSHELIAIAHRLMEAAAIAVTAEAHAALLVKE